MSATAFCCKSITYQASDFDIGLSTIQNHNLPGFKQNRANMPSLVESLSDFVSSIFNAIIAVFSSITALFQNLLATVFDLVRTLFATLGTMVSGLAHTFEGLTKFVLSKYLPSRCVRIHF